jgi:hypothetical protein
MVALGQVVEPHQDHVHYPEPVMEQGCEIEGLQCVNKHEMTYEIVGHVLFLIAVTHQTTYGFGCRATYACLWPVFPCFNESGRDIISGRKPLSLLHTSLLPS